MDDRGVKKLMTSIDAVSIQRLSVRPGRVPGSAVLEIGLNADDWLELELQDEDLKAVISALVECSLYREQLFPAAGVKAGMH